MKSILISVLFLVSCGSSVDKIADAIATSNATPTAVPGSASPVATVRPVSSNNAELELAILGKWDLYSRGCEGENFSWEFFPAGSCYILKPYGTRYKCTWQWIGDAQMKLCVGQECRTDARIFFDRNSSMLTIVSDKCTTEYKRPELN